MCAERTYLCNTGEGGMHHDMKMTFCVVFELEKNLYLILISKMEEFDEMKM